MLYRVHVGQEVLWPSGEVRATAGEVFDGYDSEGSPRSRAFAAAILARFRDAIYPVEGPVTATAPVPASFANDLEAMCPGGLEACASVAPPAPPKPPSKPRKKSGKLPQPDDEVPEAAPERLGDPEE